MRALGRGKAGLRWGIPAIESRCGDERARSGSRFEVPLGGQLLEGQRNGIAPESKPLGKLPRAEHLGAGSEAARLDALAQSPGELYAARLPGGAGREERLEPKRLPHTDRKWHVTGSQSCPRIVACISSR